MKKSTFSAPANAALGKFSSIVAERFVAKSAAPKYFIVLFDFSVDEEKPASARNYTLQNYYEQLEHFLAKKHGASPRIRKAYAYTMVYQSKNLKRNIIYSFSFSFVAELTDGKTYGQKKERVTEVVFFLSLFRSHSKLCLSQT